MKKIFILLHLVLITSAAWASQIDHNSSKECAVCHYEWMTEFVYDLKGTDIVDYQSEKVVATEKMCFSCHNGTVADSRIRIWSGDMHKIKNAVPTHMQVPENLPLDDGKINCRTCHSAHATGDPKAEGVKKGVFLRMKNTDSQLCMACHTQYGPGTGHSHPQKRPEKNVTAIDEKLAELGAKLGSQGQIVCQSCHTPHSPRDKKLLIYAVQDSKLCSLCHADKVNPKNGLYIQGMLNHPIDIRHDNPEQVALVKKAGGRYGTNDEVICLTCHRPHEGATDTLLIQNNTNSRLCITCHDEKKTVFNGKHDMHQVTGFRTKDGRSAQEKGACQSCHAPHGWSLELATTGRDMLSAGCLSCHREGGFAGKTPLSAKRFNHAVGKQIKDDMKPDALPLFAPQSNRANGHISERDSGNMITCATCHDVHAGNTNFLRADAESGRLCMKCHREKEVINKTAHGQQKLSKNCLSCHTIHNCENKRLLNSCENDGCLECHREGGSAQNSSVDPKHSHPVNMQVDQKLRAPFKTLTDGRFTCVTCHDPHTPSKRDNMQKDFLRGEYTEPDALCIGCHETQKEIIGSDHDHRKKGSDSVCGQCHSVHNAKSATNIMAVAYPYMDKDDSCKTCHSLNGTAHQKTITGGHKLGKITQAEKYRKYIITHGGDDFIYCSSCHTVHNNGPRKDAEGTISDSFLDRKLFKNENFCLGCHGDKTEFSISKHNVNHFVKHTQESERLTAQGDTCGACHKVHNSGYYLFEKSLGEDYEKICTSCHSKKGLASRTSISSSHKINVELKRKTSASDYLQNGKLVCITCHDPHAGNKAMLRKLDGQNLCVSCHQDQKTVQLSKHDLANVSYLKSEVGKDALHNGCAACHKPHNYPAKNRLMWAFDFNRGSLFGKKSAFVFDMCTDCHSNGGIGRKKIPEVLTHENIFKILPLKVKEDVAQYLYDENGVCAMNGSITCQTCHDPHVWENEIKSTDTAVTQNSGHGFLKPNVKAQFCAKCHGMEQSNELFSQFHDKKFRESRNKKQGKMGVLLNLMRIQMNMKSIQSE